MPKFKCKEEAIGYYVASVIYHVVYAPYNLYHWLRFQWMIKVYIPYQLRQISKLSKKMKEQ